MMKKSQSMLVLSVGVFAVCACAETLVMGKAGDGEAAHSFYNPTDWIREDGSVVNAAPTKGNDYIVANGYVMNVNVTTNFAGDSLQFGYLGGTRGVFFQTSHNQTVTVNRLILANGLYRVWQNAGNASMSYLKGKIEVISPATAPFRICPTHDAVNSSTGYDITWASDISGAAGVGLLINRIAPEKKARLVFSGNNSGYLGNIAVEGTNLTFEVTKAVSLGGALESFNPEALTLDKQAIFDCSAAEETLSSTVNRGITVKSFGAKLNVQSGKRLCVQWPIRLDGNLEKIGDGTVYLDSDITGSGKILVSSGSVAVPVGKTNVIDSLAFGDGCLEVAYDMDDGSCGVFEFSEIPDSNIQVKPPAVRGITIPFFRVPVSAGLLDVSIFKSVDNVDQFNVPSFTVNVKEEDGYNVAYITTAKTVMPIPGYKDIYALQYPERWDDGELFHQCCDYVIDVKSAGRQQKFSIGDLSSLDESVLDYTMPPGTSITFTGHEFKQNGTTVASNSIWLIRQRVFTGDVRAVGNRVLFSAFGNTKPTSAEKSYADESTGDIHVLKGSLFVSNTKGNDEGFKFQAGYARTVRIESKIFGSGTISLQAAGADAAAKIATYELVGENSFTGKWFVYNTKGSNLLTVRFDDAQCFGPGGAANDDILFQGGNLLIYPFESTVLNLPKRVLYFYSGNIDIKINSGDEFKIDSSVTFRNGSTDNQTILRKTGGGVWAIGGTVKLEKKMPVLSMVGP